MEATAHSRFQRFGTRKVGQVLREIRDETGSSIQPAADRVVIAQYLPLEGLEKGKYHLTVLVEDRISGKKVTETADFEIVG